MAFTRWQDIKHKASQEKVAHEKGEALAEYDRMGYAALRKARELTQVEIAGRLNISQGNVAALEARTDLHISTLAKYIRALGGRLEMQAVFPEATFNLEPPQQAEPNPKRETAIPLKQKAKSGTTKSPIDRSVKRGTTPRRAVAAAS